MVPRSITTRLSGLRQREMFQRFAWGGMRVLAFALIVFLLACAVDWFIDRWEETPYAVRLPLLVAQIILAGVLFVFLVVRPLARPLPDEKLALWVEEKHPRLCHRLISAVQLNQPDADVQGMSRELIHVVTLEAERAAERIDFDGLVDRRRVLWGAGFLVPALLLFALPFVVWPSVFPVLAARQFLADIEIPRSIYLHATSDEVWPKGEKVRLQIRATGPGILDEPDGEIVIRWARGDKAPSRLPLEFISREGGEAIYAVDIPATLGGEAAKGDDQDGDGPAPVYFTYSAWLGDGRLREPGTVRHAPRPDAREQAFVRLPEFCGKTPSGERYEQGASRGDVEGIPGSQVRVAVEVQKPVEKARLHLYTRRFKGFDERGNSLWDDVPRGSLVVRLDQSKKKGQVTFSIVPDAADKKKEIEPYTHYVVEVVDKYGFVNVPKPMRNLRVIPEPRPEVALLREQFPPEAAVPPQFAELYVHTGMPAREGDKIRIGYKCFGPYGLGSVSLQYRKIVGPIGRSGTLRRFLWAWVDNEEEVPQEDWTELPLPEETRINLLTGKEEDLGEFLHDQGVFERTPWEKSVGFYAVPSPDPHHLLGRIKGGGRYDLELKGLVNRAGKAFTLKKGDQIEYRIKVYADKKASLARPWNVSETRVTSIEDFDGVWDWLNASWAEQDRIRTLEKSQRGVFEKSK